MSCPRPSLIGFLAIGLSLAATPASAKDRALTRIPPNVQQCAVEGQRCAFSGRKKVYYGAESSWVVRLAADGIDCTNDEFGDPIVGTVKACYVAGGGDSDSSAGDVAQVKGPNVLRVTYGGIDTGSFVQTGSGLWAEYKRGQLDQHASFTELNRDEWSVYLRKSDGASVQLDLWKKEVIVNGGAMYTIEDSHGDTGAPVTGTTVELVGYTGSESGSFVQTSPGLWAEYKSGSPDPHAAFTLMGRDEASVLLKKTDGASVQLDLEAKVVRVNAIELYTVSGAL